MICFNALAYRPIACGISPLPFVFGLFANEAKATAENATLKCDSGLSALTKGTRKSNHPLDVGSRGVCTKLCKKKQDACCSIGTDKVPATNSIEEFESDGDIRGLPLLTFMSSCDVLEKVICPLWNIVVTAFLP